MAGTGSVRSGFGAEQRALFLAALALFTFTVVVGILNGTDLVDFERKTLLTHVHAGTLGWISLGVFASALSLFGAGADGWRASLPRPLTAATIATVAGYVTAFLLTSGYARPVLGTLALVVIVGWFAWILAGRERTVLSVPRLAVLAAITSLTIGAVLGVLLGLDIAGRDVLPDGGEGAHPAAMVIGFLIPVGMALAEWRLRPEALDEPVRRSGWLQVGLPFVGGVLVMVGLLADVVPLVALSLPFELVGVGIFVARVLPAIRALDWSSPSWARGGALTTLFLVINLGLFVYLVGRYQGDFDDVPTRLILALDHLMFIGVMTNSLFGAAQEAASARVAPQADHVVFWGMNAGLVVFVLGLIADSPALKRVGTPVMGTAILIGIGVTAARLVTSSNTSSSGMAFQPGPDEPRILVKGND